jgi:carbon storage regulator
MLVLTRTIGKKIIVQTGSEEIEVAVLGVNGNQVRLGVQAPDHVAIDREEIAQRKAANPVERAHG